MIPVIKAIDKTLRRSMELEERYSRTAEVEVARSDHSHTAKHCRIRRQEA